MRNQLMTLFFLFIISCSPFQKNNFNIETETRLILDLHNLQKTFHLEKNANNFSELFSDHFISVNKGKVTSPSVLENRSKFQNYFDSVEFIKWDDLETPQVRFSDDGSMAFTIVKKEIIIRYPNEKKDTIEEKTVFAWTTIYRKQKGKWKIECVTSTNLPEEKRMIE